MRQQQTDAFPAPPRTKRATFSLPTETAARITRLAGRMGVSQSAFVSELLSEPLAALAAIIDELPPSGATPHDVKRARGRSLALIRDAMAEAQSLVDEVAAMPAPKRKRKSRGG